MINVLFKKNESDIFSVDRGINQKRMENCINALIRFISYHLISLHFNKENYHSNLFKKQDYFKLWHGRDTYDVTIKFKITSIFSPIRASVTPSLKSILNDIYYIYFTFIFSDEWIISPRKWTTICLTFSMIFWTLRTNFYEQVGDSLTGSQFIELRKYMYTIMCIFI